MRSFGSIFALVFMSLSLVFAGPVSRAMAVPGSQMMQLCIDGVVQSVSVGIDGQPVTPDADCGAAHTCCMLAAGGLIPDTPAHTTVPAFEDLAAIAAVAPISFPDYLSAHPRGPPVSRVGWMHQTDILS
ncbi:hypothetical protein I5535_02345 [Rhodobacteraceae bacterium F11138]|nr:hypothetical protein [Rhodobacteraceae bacterium F11138]